MGIVVIEYYIDGSAKGNTIGAGIVKINEYGFIEKRHFTTEHINPTSQIAEGYALERALEMIRENDIHKNEMIDLYTDCRELITCMTFNQHIEFHRSEFFSKQETNDYFQYLRDVYKELIIRKSKSCIYHCVKVNEARPLIKMFFKDDAQDKKYLQEAHMMSRKYIKKEETKVLKIELKAVRKDKTWHIIKNNKEMIAVNKRPLIAFSEALMQPDIQNKEIKLCANLETLLKTTSNNKPSTEPMKIAMKTIEKYKKVFVF